MADVEIRDRLDAAIDRLEMLYVVCCADDGIEDAAAGMARTICAIRDELREVDAALGEGAEDER